MSLMEFVIYPVFVGIALLIFQKMQKWYEKKEARLTEHSQLMMTAIVMLLQSSEIQITALKKIKDENNKPLINGELATMKDKISNFNAELEKFLINNQN